MNKNECGFRLPIDEQSGRILGTGRHRDGEQQHVGLIHTPSIHLMRHFSHGCLHLVRRGEAIPGCYHPKKSYENCPMLKRFTELD